MYHGFGIYFSQDFDEDFVHRMGLGFVDDDVWRGSIARAPKPDRCVNAQAQPRVLSMGEQQIPDVLLIQLGEWARDLAQKTAAFAVVADAVFDRGVVENVAHAKFGNPGVTPPSRSRPSRQYASDSSIPIEERPSSIATSQVVNVPAKQSKTVAGIG